MKDAQITQSVSMGDVCQYTYHIWTQWHQPPDHEYCRDNNDVDANVNDKNANTDKSDDNAVQLY